MLSLLWNPRTARDTDDPAVDGATPPNEDLLVFEDDGLADVDDETHPPYPEPAASEPPHPLVCCCGHKAQQVVSPTFFSSCSNEDLSRSREALSGVKSAEAAS